MSESGLTAEGLAERGLRLHAIAAMAANRVIGRDGKLPWRLPEDLRFFKKTTMGHPVVMGRRTFASLPAPLPGRRNLVLSRSLDTVEGAEILRDPAGLLRLDIRGDVFVAGGAGVYRALFPLCTTLLLTRLHDSYPGDTVLPPFEEWLREEAVLAAYPGFDIVRYRNKNAAAWTTTPA